MSKTDNTDPWVSDQYTEVHRVYIEWKEPDALIAGIIEGVTAVTGADFMDLPPLREVIDPEALERLLRNSTNSQVQSEPFVRFTYAGYMIIVSGNGRISIFTAE